MSDKVILLVEDNPDDATLTLDAIGQSDVRGRVVVVDDGAAALEYLFRTGAYAERDPDCEPALMLLDLKLPKMDGLEVLRRTRADPRGKRVPIVVLSSSKEAHDVAQSYELGANSYIRKPVDYDAFVEVVRAVGEYWLRLNETPPGTLTP